MDCSSAMISARYQTPKKTAHSFIVLITVPQTLARSLGRWCVELDCVWPVNSWFQLDYVMCSRDCCCLKAVCRHSRLLLPIVMFSEGIKGRRNKFLTVKFCQICANFITAMVFGGLQCDLIRFLVRTCKHRCPWSLSHFLKFTFEASDFFLGAEKKASYLMVVSRDFY